MINTGEKVKVVAAVLVQGWIQFLAALAIILHQDDLKKRMTKITATWRNGCFEKMAYHYLATACCQVSPRFFSRQFEKKICKIQKNSG